MLAGGFAGGVFLVCVIDRRWERSREEKGRSTNLLFPPAWSQ